MEQLTQVCVDWTTLLVPAVAMWAIVGINVYRADAERPWIDTFYLLAMVLIGILTWRTMSSNDAGWLIHTATLGTMIVFGVLPRREVVEEAINCVS